MIASGEVQTRASVSRKTPIGRALGRRLTDTPPELSWRRRGKDVAMLKTSLARIRDGLHDAGCVRSAWRTCPALVDKIQLLVDPQGGRPAKRQWAAAQADIAPSGDAPGVARLTRNRALAADRRILQPLGAFEPDTARWVRPGASVDRQVVLRGDEHPRASADGQGGVSDRRRTSSSRLPVNKLSKLPERSARAAGRYSTVARPDPAGSPQYRVETRPQADRVARTGCSGSSGTPRPSQPGGRCYAIVHVPSPNGISWAC